MEKNVLNTDLTGKVAVVTGASGTLFSIFAKALARAVQRWRCWAATWISSRSWQMRSRPRAALPRDTPAT